MTRISWLAKTRRALVGTTVFTMLASCGGDPAPRAASPTQGGQTQETIVQAGIAITPGFVRTPSKGAPATAGYLSLTASLDDTLLKVSTEAASSVELHTMTMQEGVMRMRPLPQIDLPAGQTVALAPGGLHLMIMQPDQSLVAAGTVEITLTFENAGDITVALPVQRTAGGDAHAHH